MGITLQEAQKVIDAAIAHCQSIGLRMSVAVLDEHGDLVASARMDGSRPFTPDVARGKALATALWRQPSAALAERAASSVGQLVNHLYGNRVVYGQGAVPIMRGDEFIAAVGASGARPEQDEEVARAGASALGVGSAAS